MGQVCGEVCQFLARILALGYDISMIQRLFGSFASISMMALLLSSCGSDVEKPPAAVDCSLDPSGAPFTFTFTNSGPRILRLAYGCGGSLPVRLVTSHGELSIGTGVDSCELGCEVVYAGTAGFGCSDCGPGYGAPLGPGEMATIMWDRRVYEAHTVPVACASEATTNTCALGLLVKETAPVTGTLRVCTDMDEFADGFCTTSEDIPINVDLSKDSATIDVK